MAENKIYTHEYILSIFQSRIAGLSADTAYKYRRTLSDFDCFLTSHRLSLAGVTGVSIADWVVELLRQGLSSATIISRLNILNGLFKTASEKDVLHFRGEPRALASKLASDVFAFPPLLKASLFDKSLSQMQAFAKDREQTYVCGDMLLFSVLSGAKPLEEIVYLTKENIDEYKGLARPILERNVSGRRKYVFDLKQSYQTKGQIRALVTEELQRAFSGLSDAEGFVFEDLAASLWVAFAIRCGATASDALGCVGVAAPYAVPAFCTPAEDMQSRRAQWADSVESLLTLDLPKWYAMRLRRGVRYEELRKDVHEKIKPMPELFYPVETIRKQLRGKSVITEQPFISQTVFFKSYPENVLPMFAEIGDKAWCIKISNSLDSPYAVIPQKEMLRFQRAIGVFSSDAEVHPLGSLTPRPGETVILIQAGYSNREAEVEEILESECGTVLFRVRLTTDYGYEWRATVDSRQIERLIKG